MTHLFRMTLATAAVWLFASHPVEAERFRSRQPSLADTMAEDAALRDACFLDGRHGWAVGDRGVILRTDDGGRRWLRQNSPVDCPLTSVWFADAEHGWAVGGVTTPYTHSTRGVVLHTSDGGYSWAELSAPNLPRLRGVRFFDAQNGVAFGDSNALSPSGVYQTRDGGGHWEALHALDRHAWLAGGFPVPGRGGWSVPQEPSRRSTAARSPRWSPPKGNSCRSTIDSRAGAFAFRPPARVAWLATAACC